MENFGTRVSPRVNGAGLMVKRPMVIANQATIPRGVTIILEAGFASGLNTLQVGFCINL